jgi:formylmethanofuran dehydrogenase subunit E
MKPTGYERIKHCYICGDPSYPNDMRDMGDGFWICKHHEYDVRECRTCGEAFMITDLELIDDEWYCNRCYKIKLEV